ncbi:hypothetical protein CVT24_007548 [Panaeolus cyanescens]|uniref:F-box domain-containing protein n=1 Tax=Panaeolus cyanescens TaxID=181874 RepID=A0A409WZX3_9AGAR|nr:hypothetical protein CVT24_007548 [Panaeolus cyanescens]
MWNANIDLIPSAWEYCDATQVPEFLEMCFQKSHQRLRSLSVNTQDPGMSLNMQVCILPASQYCLRRLYIASRHLSELSSDLLFPVLETLFVHLIDDDPEHAVSIHWRSFPQLKQFYISQESGYKDLSFRQTVLLQPIVPVPLVELSLRSVKATDILSILSTISSIEHLSIEDIEFDLDTDQLCECPNLRFLSLDSSFILAYIAAPRLRILHVDGIMPTPITLTEFLSRSVVLETLATSCIEPAMLELLPHLKRLLIVGNNRCFPDILSDLAHNRLSMEYLARLDKISIVATRLNSKVYPAENWHFRMSMLCFLSHLESGPGLTIDIWIPHFHTSEPVRHDNGDHPRIYLNGKPIKRTVMAKTPHLAIMSRQARNEISTEMASQLVYEL